MRTLAIGRHKEIPGDWYDTPKELWAFAQPRVAGGPVAVARRFLADNGERLGLGRVRGKLDRPRVIGSLGATHLIFRQRHRARGIFRAYVTVHVGSDGRVYLCKNRAVPDQQLDSRGSFAIGRARALRKALHALRARRGPLRHIGATEEIWFPTRARLRPAYRLRVHCEHPREEWIILVDAESGRILSRYDNLSQSRGIANVFDPNPVAALDDWRALRGDVRARTPPAAAYRTVELEDLSGTGYLDGRLVTTRPTRHRVHRPDHLFFFTSDQPGFEEVMAYFHVTRAIHYLERLGFSGPRRIFKSPLPIDVRGTRDDNSWYSPGSRSLTFGTGGVDDAEDAEIILHEFGHAIQDAICPDFGQSEEAAAMGEGFGDYFAASFFAERKPAEYRNLVMSWDAIEDDERGLPRLRRMDGRATYRAFEKGGDCHDNGQIWSAALWEIHGALGRRVADPIIIESHFQLDGFTTFARGARAILDADRNLNRGAHVRWLTAMFRRRNIGPL